MADNAELESFRRQWREEVARRTRPERTQAPRANSSTPAPARPTQFPPTRHELADREEEEEEEEEEQGQEPEGSSSIGHDIAQYVGDLSLGGDEDAFHSQAHKQEPKSALEHFERAVEKEAEGSLGDSLQHYRKAYRLDSSVDKTYRNKHFAAAWKKPAQPQASSSTQGPISQQAQDEPVRLPTPELIASFANCPIPQAEPIIENTPPPPCPISNVPSEVLVEILRHVALTDPASLVRVSLTCKRLAYHFAHEQHIWKRLCQGPEFGFKNMHYSFACDLLGHQEYTLEPRPRYTPFPIDAPVEIPKSLSSWSQVFQTFPRIRFTGIYICTVNYTRAGAASAYQNVSWNSPIHIVTYYRYLRFYPDGTVINLLTTTEPTAIVPHISKENVAIARAPTHAQRQQQRQVTGAGSAGSTVSGAPDPMPPIAMSTLSYTRRGRWHLVHPNTGSEPLESEPKLGPSSNNASDKSSASALDPRDVIIETEGANDRYIYTMHLSLRSSSAGSRPADSRTALNPSKNTKLAWKGFWSYNKVTDDWSEFGLRNDKAFVFRRVRGWGM